MIIFMRIAFLVLLFLAKIRFPKSESIPSIIRKKNSGKVLEAIRKIEKVDGL